MAVNILSSSQKRNVVIGRSHGHTLKHLATRFKVSPDTISRVLKENQVANDNQFKPIEITDHQLIKVYAKPELVKVEVKVEPTPVWNASSKFISITLGREVFNADSDHPCFKQALQLLIDGKVMEALDIINVEKAITRFVDGDVRIEDGQLFFKDIELKTGLTNRIVTLMNEGKDFKFLLPFLHNLMENPSRKAVYRLFDFLEANDIKITEDGHFIAWKKVGPKYLDIYTGTMDNSPGKEVRVDRNQVDEDDKRTCSHGLHVCSKSYLGSYGSCSNNKVVSVKVHPKDVVSIPTDYNNAKMRTAGYVVLADVTNRV